MTTAHRPTFHNAIAGDSSSKRVAPTKKVHARELAAQTVLKERQPGQGTREDLEERDFKAELEAKEAAHFGAKRRAALLDGSSQSELPEPIKLLQLEDIPDEPNPFPDDADDEGPRALQSGAARKRGIAQATGNSSSEDEESDDDEEAELLRELENIKKERAEEEAKKKEEEERQRAESEKELIATSNPLVVATAGGGGSLSRGWEDDAVFKNQAKLSATQKSDAKKKRFINDPVRSEFHKKFLQKYVT